MHRPIHPIKVTRPVPNLNSGSPLRFGFLLIPLALALFALSPLALAVTPAPAGGYRNQNTAEGDNALFSLTTRSGQYRDWFSSAVKDTTGINNTANGFGALQSNTTGYHNSASGVSALLANTAGHDNTANGLQALASNTTGSFNIAVGINAGAKLTTGQ